MSFDRISIIRQRVECRIGITQEERKVSQALRITCHIFPHFPLTDLNEDISKTIDYDVVSKIVSKTAKNKTYQLVETLAEEIANAILKNPSINKIEVLVEKFFLTDAESVIVALTKS